MAILDTDTVNGWVRKACSGSAGYALDDNDTLLLTGAAAMSNSFQHTFWKLPLKNVIPRNTALTAGSPTGTNGNFYLYEDTTNLLFGKSTIAAMGISGISLPNSTNIAFGSYTDFSIAGWVKYNNTGDAAATKIWWLHSWGDPWTGIAFTLEGQKIGVYATTSSSISAGTSSRIYLSTGGYPLNTWFYLNIVRSSGVLSIYVNGVLVGQVSETTAYPNTFFNPTEGGAAAYFASMQDIRVSKVARDGSFVPGNVFGY